MMDLIREYTESTFLAGTLLLTIVALFFIPALSPLRGRRPFARRNLHQHFVRIDGRRWDFFNLQWLIGSVVDCCFHLSLGINGKVDVNDFDIAICDIKGYLSIRSHLATA
jgi:hypothetical protein